MKPAKALAAVLALMTAVLAQQTGQTAPDFKLADLSGKPMTLASLKKPAVITFWASWCEVCRAEFPGLHAVAKEKKLNHYVISREPADSRKVVQDYMKQYPAFTPLVSLAGGDKAVDVYNRYKIFGQPWTFVLDTQAKIAWAHPGAVNVDEFKKQLAQVGVQREER